MEWRVREVKNETKLVLEKVDLGDFKTEDSKRELKNGYARVLIEASALNKRDEWITLRMYPRIQLNRILGSDGCGVCVRVNSKGEGKEIIGKQVIIDPSIGWDRNSELSPSERFSILGMPVDGTFGMMLDVPIENLYLKPDHLTVEQAAALPLAGVTAYRALFTKGKATSTSRILVTGIGGGVAMFALQFGVAIGADVYVTSSDQKKIDYAVSLGAKGGVNYKTSSDWTKELKNLLTKSGNKKMLDVVVDGAGGEDLGSIIRIMQGGGRLVSYGATAGSNTSITLPHLFLNNIDLLGTAMGSPEDFQRMLKLVNDKKIVPIVDSVCLFSLPSK